MNAPTHRPDRKWIILAAGAGVLEWDENGRAISLEPKPLQPRSWNAVTGPDFYCSDVVKVASNVTPSAGGGLELPDLSRVYMEPVEPEDVVLNREPAWLDTVAHDWPLEALTFSSTAAKQKSIAAGRLDEVACNTGWNA